MHTLPCGVTIVTTKEVFLEVLKWLGGGGVALFGVFLTSKKNRTNRHVGIINDLQEENRRKDERLDIQDEKIQTLVVQMDEMRKCMFELQTSEHKTELKSIELKSKNERLEEEKRIMSERVELLTRERDEIKKQLEDKILEIETELNKRIDILIKENKELRRRIEDIINNND